jgi:hypothetical protein
LLEPGDRAHGNPVADDKKHEGAARWILPGLIAGLPYAAFAMLVAIFTSANWAPPQGIAKSVGIGAQGHKFQPVPFVLGILGHMVNSVVLRISFIAIGRAVHLRGAGSVIGGMVYGLVVYVGLYWGLLRRLLPSTSRSFLSAKPERAWIVAHLIFGGVLGAVVRMGRCAKHREPAVRPSVA